MTPRRSSSALYVTAFAVAVVWISAPDTDARRPFPPYRHLGEAVAESAGYWVWEEDGQSVRNSETGLICPAAIGEYSVVLLSNRMDALYHQARCTYESGSRLISVSHYPPANEVESRACSGAMRVIENWSAVAMCEYNQGMISSVLADSSRASAETDESLLRDFLIATRVP